MLDNFFKRHDMPLSRNEEGLVYTPSETGRLELRDIEKTCARLFSTEDGRKVLAYLQVMTFHRALGPNNSDAQLRYAEGQRAMVASILRLIDRGRKPA